MKRFLLSLAISVIFIWWMAPVCAEYRVYQYSVTARVDLSYDAQSYITLSTLDPISYQAYHGGRDSIRVDLINTWVCKGHTGGKDLCPSPYETQANASMAAAPAAEDLSAKGAGGNQ